MSDKNDGYTQSLRFFLDRLKRDEIEIFSVIREDFLLSAIVKEFERNNKTPVVMITDPQNGQRCVANLFANREVLDRFIQSPVYAEANANDYQNTIFTGVAPVQEEVYVDKDVDLLSLPIYRHFEGDAGRYITSGIVLAKDPDSGRHNMSFHRIMLKETNIAGISLHSRGDLWRYFNRCEELGQDLEVAVIIGAHPAFYLAGATKIPGSCDDFDWVGACLGEAVRTTHGKTIDMNVPACAEIVLEGKIKASCRADEGPFGEYTGYSTARSTRNVLEITAITKRKDAIFLDLVPGDSGEHLLLSQYTKEKILFEKLRLEVPSVKALLIPMNSCHFHAYVKIDPEMDGEVRRMMLLLFGLDPYLKLIIAVNSDVDISSENEVMWAISTRMQADHDVFIVSDVICNRLDPSSKEGVGAKMGIDATMSIGNNAPRISLPYEIVEKAQKLLDQTRRVT